MWTGHNPARQRAALYENFCKVPVPSDHETLKQGSFKPEYKGQMELYLRWLAQHEREPEENLPLGIILCAGKNTEQIELLELGTAGIHVAEYLTVLPPPEVLREKLHKAIETARARIEARENYGAPEE